MPRTLTLLSKRVFSEMVDVAYRGSRLRDSPDHGETHWQQVAAVGLDLASRLPEVDPAAVLLFGLFHDCRRVSEYHDPLHGQRGAAALMSYSMMGFRDELAPSIAYAATACVHHHGGEALDPSYGTIIQTIGVCLDADRLTLPRVGIKVDRRYLSTTQAVLRMNDPHYLDNIGSPTWDELFHRYQKLEATRGN